MERYADPDFSLVQARAIQADQYGDYSDGRWAWRLVDVEPLDPTVPARGRQGLWEWKPCAT